MSLPVVIAVGVALATALGLLFLSTRRGSEPAGPAEAERLAQLLVAELRLYNQEALERLRDGLSDPADLETLRQEIQRTRTMFKDRAGSQQLPALDRILREILGDLIDDQEAG